MLAFDWRVLASVDAVLNATAFVLITAGLIAIKRGDERLHKRLMLTAFGVSAVFLVCYLTYHVNAEPVKYAGSWGVIYYPLLISHIVLAVVQLPLIVLTIRAGLRDDRVKHKKLAKVTAPMWLYVSVTGVVVYLMLY